LVPAARRSCWSGDPSPYVNRRAWESRLAEDWLRSVLEEARRGTLPGLVRTGATFADAAAERLRYIEHDRGRKPSTVAGYKVMVRSMLLPAFGELQLEAITTPMIGRWIGSIALSASTRTKAIVRK